MYNRHAVAICCGLVIILCISGCATRCMSPKERSYALALGVLKNPRQADTYQKIESMKDVDALRIIAFTAESAAWRMDAGPDVEFDNQLHEIALAAIHRLFILDSEIATEVIADYKKAFVVDGSVSLLFRQWEEERNALQSQRASDVVPDESSTFNTIDSILLQAILYSKGKGCYPDFSLIEIPIDTLVKQGRPADQYGRAIRYSVTNDVLNVRSAGRDGLFETDDDIIGTASLNQTGRHIKGKCGTFEYEVEW